MVPMLGSGPSTGLWRWGFTEGWFVGLDFEMGPVGGLCWGDRAPLLPDHGAREAQALRFPHGNAEAGLPQFKAASDIKAP